jgi:hypothetical protein
LEQSLRYPVWRCLVLRKRASEFGVGVIGGTVKEPGFLKQALREPVWRELV